MNCKTYYRLLDREFSEKVGCKVWLADDLDSPTDDPATALKTSEPDWFVANFGFEAEPLPPDQQMIMMNQRRLL